MKISGGEVTTIAAINAGGWDADLIVPAARIIAVDHIAETTPAHGIVTNNLLAPALGVAVPAGQILSADRIDVDHMRNLTGAHGIVVTSGDVLRIDHISEATGAHGIVLDNIETGRQTGTGNSATGAVLCFSEGGVDAHGAAGVPLCAFRVQRAGVYDVKVWNSQAFAGGGHLHVYINGAGGASSTANNAAGTNEDLGNMTFAVGDVIEMDTHVASPAGQVGLLSLYNADGMYP